MVKYKIRTVKNGFIVEHDNVIFAIEYEPHSGFGEKEIELTKENYMKAESRLLEYMSQRLQTERMICPNRKLSLKIEWIV